MSHPRLRQDAEHAPLRGVSIESTELSTEEKLARIERTIAWADSEMATIYPYVKDLAQTRVELFNPASAGFDQQVPFDEQLYDDITMNVEPLKEALDHRNKAMLTFQETNFSYNEDEDDTEEERYAKKAMRQSTLKVGQALGFLPQVPGEAHDPLEKWIDMQESTQEPIEGKVDAIVVAAAAAMTNPKRLEDAIRDIESGRVDTDTIIIATCHRPSFPHEGPTMEAAGLEAGDREFSTCVKTAEALLGASFDTWGYNETKYGDESVYNFYVTTQVAIGDKLVTLSIIAAQMDPKRANAERGKPWRSDTRETFTAAATLLPEDSKRIVVKSHDTWINYQDIIARDVFELGFGLDVFTSGPRNSDRLAYAVDEKGRPVLDEQGHPVFDVNKAEQVIDEVGKVYVDLSKLRSKAVTMRSLLLQEATS